MKCLVSRRPREAGRPAYVKGEGVSVKTDAGLCVCHCFVVYKALSYSLLSFIKR